MSIKKIITSLSTRIPQATFTRHRNLALFEWMNTNAPGKMILNLGSGVGNFDGFLSPDVRMINLDINPEKPHLHLVGDAQRLPFIDASFDIVYSIAVLEHVPKPWLAASEIVRILRPGGHVVLDLPFLNAIHDDHDYFRFTDKGIRMLFDDWNFIPVLEQVGSGGGSFIGAFLFQYLKLFCPGRLLKILWDVVMRYPFALFRFLDIPVNNSPGLRLTANSFSFIGRTP